jgi:hypothetical protein
VSHKWTDRLRLYRRMILPPFTRASNSTMRRAITLSALVTVPLVASSQAPAARTDSSARGVEAKLRRADGEEVKALLANDTRVLNQIWSNEFVVTNPLNKFVNKQQVLGLITSGVLAFKSYNRQIEYVRIYGQTAVVAGAETVVWAGKMPMAGKTSHLRFTAIWMRKGAGWQEVARHANIIPEP